MEFVFATNNNYTNENSNLYIAICIVDMKITRQAHTIKNILLIRKISTTCNNLRISSKSRAKFPGNVGNSLAKSEIAHNLFKRLNTESKIIVDSFHYAYSQMGCKIATCSLGLHKIYLKLPFIGLVCKTFLYLYTNSNGISRNKRGFIETDKFDIITDLCAFNITV